MKLYKFILCVFSLIACKAYGQSTISLPTGTVPTTPQFRIKNPADSLRETWVNFPFYSTNRFYSATELNAMFRDTNSIANAVSKTYSDSLTAMSNFRTDTITAALRVGKTSNFQYPVGFPFRPFTIYEQNGQFHTSTKPEDLVQQRIQQLQPYFVDYANGVDAPSNGLSPSSPFKTIKYAIITVGARLIYVAPGIHKIDTWGNMFPGSAAFDVFIMGSGRDKTYITTAPATDPVWTNTSGSTYTTTVSTPINVVDFAYKDSYGLPLKLTPVNSTLSVDTTSNSVYINGNIVTINVGRVPDGDILVNTNVSAGNRYNHNVGTLYIENMSFIGGLTTLYTNTLITPTLPTHNYIFKNINFVYSAGNGLNMTYPLMAWSDNCIAAHNPNDGFNYNTNNIYYIAHKSNIIETHCQAFNNSGNTNNATNNGSSAHYGLITLRIGGKYFNNRGPNIIDIASSVAQNLSAPLSLCIGVESNNSLGFTNGVVNSYKAGFVTNGDVADTARMWLYKCISRNDSLSLYAASGKSKIYNYQSIYDGDTSGSIEPYIMGGVSTYALPNLLSYTAKPFLLPGSQGDLPYYSAAGTVSNLSKNSTSTRYLSNTGTNNNPAWSQINLTNGVSGALPIANGGTGAASFTTGSIPFSNGSILTQENNSLFWDNTNKRLGINTSTPTHPVTIGQTAGSLGHAIYNTTDQTTNYERGLFQWISNIFHIGTQNGGTGVARSIKLAPGFSSTKEFLINAGDMGTYSFKADHITGARSIEAIGTYTNGAGYVNTVTIRPTINQTGSGGYRALWVTPSETATGSTGGYLLDLGTGGISSHTSKFSVNNAGVITTTTPATSINNYDILTRNTSTGIIEKIPATYSGNYIASGNGTSTSISIPHGVANVSASSIVTVTPKTLASAGYNYVTTDSVNINIFYSTAPAAGTNNLSFDIQVKP